MMASVRANNRDSPNRSQTPLAAADRLASLETTRIKRPATQSPLPSLSELSHEQITGSSP